MIKNCKEKSHSFYYLIKFDIIKKVLPTFLITYGDDFKTYKDVSQYIHWKKNIKYSLILIY